MKNNRGTQGYAGSYNVNNLSGSLSESLGNQVFIGSKYGVPMKQEETTIIKMEYQPQPQVTKNNQKSLNDQLTQLKNANYVYQLNIDELQQKERQLNQQIILLNNQNRLLQHNYKRLEQEYDKIILDVKKTNENLGLQNQRLKKALLKINKEKKEYEQETKYLRNQLQYLQKQYASLSDLSHTTTNEYQLKIIQLNNRTKSIQQKFNIHKQKLNQVDRLRIQINKATTFFNQYNQQYNKLKFIIERSNQLKNQMEVQIQVSNSSNPSFIQERINNELFSMTQEYKKYNQIPIAQEIQIKLFKKLINGVALNTKFLAQQLDDSVKIKNQAKYQNSLKGILDITQYLEKIST